MLSAKKRAKLRRMAIYTVTTVTVVLIVTAAVLYILRHFGLEAVLILVIAGSAAAWGWVVRWLWKDGRITMSHIFAIWMVWTGTIMGGASYYLAYRGFTANLETLSRYVMVEVVAGVGGYFVKSGVENAIGTLSSKSGEKRDL